MAEFPALPLWTDAYLGDTTHLDTTEHGAYLLLLMVAWRSADTALPDDDVLLAKYARCGVKMWRRLRPILAPFFAVENGRWVQLRLLEEKQKVVDRRDKQAANGRASALKRKGRHSTKRSTNREPSDQQNVNQTPTPISIYTIPNGIGADAPPVDVVKSIFDEGTAILRGFAKNDGQARSLIGKWRKARGDDWTLRAIRSCRDQPGGIGNPIEWIEGRLRRALSDQEIRDAVNAEVFAEARKMREAMKEDGNG